MSKKKLCILYFNLYFTIVLLGILLPEMSSCLVLLQLRNSTVIQSSQVVPVMEHLLDIVDNFNKLAPGLDRDDKEDLAWPGVFSK